MTNVPLMKYTKQRKLACRPVFNFWTDRYTPHRYYDWILRTGLQHSDRPVLAKKFSSLD